MKNSLLLTLIFLLIGGVSKAQITTVGLIGSASPFGWDADTNMVQDMDSSHLWTLAVTLTNGHVKFRADDGWDVNWGDDTFPIGTGTQNGPNIPVFAGDYIIEFNSNTGYYYLEIASSIGLIGAGTPFQSWEKDVNMTPDTSAAQDTDVFFVTLDLFADKVKFRQDDLWDVSWGGSDWPSGIAPSPGVDIVVPKAGNYNIHFNRLTGEYNFVENVSWDSIGIIGDATPGGWEAATNLTQNADDPDTWSIGTQLASGGVQFVGFVGGEQTIWGSMEFPEGTAVVDGDTIAVTAAKYIIDFNSETGAYSFSEVQIYQTMGLVGDATPLNSWDVDVDMTRDAADSSAWTLRVILNDGETKFRANDNWDVNWGAPDFPSGVATIGAFQNIPITAGEYLISFNSFSGAYNFEELVVYDTMGIVGNASPNESWDDDFYLDKSPEDENMWTSQSVSVFNFDQGGQEDGGVKFRANSGWDNNWGAADWPSGVGTQDGSNIVTVAGTYGVTFNDVTGEYAFGDPLTSTNDLLKPSQIQAYPNPANELLNIDFDEVRVSGNIHLNVYDMQGKLLLTNTKAASQFMQIDVSTLPTGNYTLQITGENMIVGKRFAVVEK